MSQLTQKRDIMKFAGAWKHMSDEEIKEIKDNIKKLREQSTKRLFEKLKRFK